MLDKQEGWVLIITERVVITMEVKICKVLPENACEYTACHIACWRSAYKGLIPDDYLDNMPNELAQRTERLTRNLTELAGEYLYYYAAVENKMIGRLIMGKSRDEDKPEAGEIQAIYLLREHWNKGYGRQMMRYAKDKLKSMGYREIILWVLEENDRARRFYEKSEFVFDGTKKEIEIGKPLVEVRYTLNL